MPLLATADNSSLKIEFFEDWRQGAWEELVLLLWVNDNSNKMGAKRDNFRKVEAFFFFHEETRSPKRRV
jgi:hypothetical protein